MDDDATVRLSFSEQGSSINPAELGEFLTRFTKVYEASIHATRRQPVEKVLLEKTQFTESLIDVLAGTAAWVAPEDSPLSEHEELRCIKLSFNSPMDVTFIGIASALTLAVIVSGGHIKFFGLDVRVNSLASALKDIKAVFAKADTRRPKGKSKVTGAPAAKAKRGPPATKA